MKSISTILRFLLPDCSFRIISIGLIVVASTGVCRVESITTLDMKGVPKDVEYYSLIPLGQGGKIYARVDSSQDKMRPVISKSEAELLIKQIDEIEAIKITNEKTVEELYKSCMRSYDCTEWVRLIKCIYKRKLKRTELGKKVTAADEKYMRLAEAAVISDVIAAIIGFIFVQTEIKKCEKLVES